MVFYSSLRPWSPAQSLTHHKNSATVGQMEEVKGNDPSGDTSVPVGTLGGK